MEILERMRKEYDFRGRVNTIDKALELGVKKKALIKLYSDKTKGTDWKFKLDFLIDTVGKEYSSSNLNLCMQIFGSTKVFEEILERDLFDFSKMDIINMFKQFGSKSVNSLASKYTYIKKYIESAKECGKGEVEKPTSLGLKFDDFRPCVKEEVSIDRIVTRTELEQGLARLENANDKIVFALLFEGISGDKYEDILTLKDSDVDIRNSLIHLSNGKEIKVSKNTVNIIKKCRVQEVGYSLAKTGRRYFIDTSSPYVVKCKLTCYTESNPMKYAGIARKLDVVKDCMELPLITGTSVYMSGVMEKIVMHEHFENNGLPLTPVECDKLLPEISNLKSSPMIREMLEHCRDKIREDLERRSWNI